MAKKFFYKTISISVAITFLTLQLTWAADMPYSVPVARGQNQTGFMKASDYETARQTQLNFVNIMQAVENFSAQENQNQEQNLPASSLLTTTSNGDVVTYEN